MAKRSHSQQTSNSKKPREENCLDIATLPSDVIRLIIRTGQESLNSMMLISKRWHALALDHLKDRKRLPVLGCLESTFRENPLIFHIPEEFRDYFGMRDWIEKWEAHGRVKYALYMYESESMSTFNKRVIQRSSGITKVKLMESAIEENGKDVTKLIRKMKVEELILTEIRSLKFLNENAQRSLLALLRATKTRKLVISGDRFFRNENDFSVLEGCLKFFTEAACLVNEIELTAEESFYNNWNKDTRRAYWKRVRVMVAGTQLSTRLLLVYRNKYNVNVRIIMQKT